MSFYFSTVLSR